MTNRVRVVKLKLTDGPLRRIAFREFIRTNHPSPANNPKVNFREKEKKILDQILGAGKYDARIRPSGINGTGKANLELGSAYFFPSVLA
ncbi:hypothetical protein ZHAS_00008974 [Anopheles sinensis]|uniref:Uncharacterized protein n=1 Tax=Anopheles sinensis TaxID=74873 RepID=A0A084VTU7_ANOSI|nr:hypothetical protein ZHAS_00008974 [Anopheles sinensis]